MSVKVLAPPYFLARVARLAGERTGGSGAYAPANSRKPRCCTKRYRVAGSERRRASFYPRSLVVSDICSDAICGVVDIAILRAKFLQFTAPLTS